MMQIAVAPGLENKIEHFFVRATSPHVHVSTEHTHRDWEALFVAEGMGFVRVQGFPDILLRPGIIVCLPPNIPHESIVEQPYRSITFRVSDYSLSAENRPFFLYDNPAQDYKVLSSLMLRLYVEDAVHNSTMIRHLIYCMLEYIRCNKGSPRAELACIEEIKQQICENFQNPYFDLTGIIARSGYSPNYLRSCFTKAEGLPPHSYLLEKRLEYAERLLRDDGPDVRVGSVAQKCGFSDPQYFSRIFKKRKGVAPSALIQRTNNQ